MGRPLDADGHEIVVEYPKMLADGYLAQNAEDEAAHTAAPVVEPDLESAHVAAQPEPDPEPVADPLDSVEVKMDHPDFAKPQTNDLYDLDNDDSKRKSKAAKKK